MIRPYELIVRNDSRRAVYAERLKMRSGIRSLLVVVYAIEIARAGRNSLRLHAPISPIITFHRDHSDLRRHETDRNLMRLRRPNDKLADALTRIAGANLNAH